METDYLNVLLQTVCGSVWPKLQNLHVHHGVDSDKITMQKKQKHCDTLY